MEPSAVEPMDTSANPATAAAMNGDGDTEAAVDEAPGTTTGLVHSSSPARRAVLARP